MIDKFSPPTDNLYKFMAIFGLITFCLSIVLDVRDATATVEARVSAYKALQQAVRDVYPSKSQEAMDLLAEYGGHLGDGKQVYPIYAKALELGGLSDEAMASIRAFEIAGEQSAIQSVISRRISYAIGSLGGLSLFVMMWGFWLWYVRVQVYEDAVLRQQVEEQVPGGVGNKPAKAGAKWTAQEEQRLREGFEQGKSIKKLARDHKRTRGAIRARLIRLDLIEDVAPQPRSIQR